MVLSWTEQATSAKQTWTYLPLCSPPRTDDLVKTVLATNDSAPGPDGIPYAAWRLHPGTSLYAMATHLDDICRSAVPPPCSVQAWIPKAKMGPIADNFRPLGMPSTFERVIDGKHCDSHDQSHCAVASSLPDSIEPLPGTTKRRTICPIYP